MGMTESFPSNKVESPAARARRLEKEFAKRYEQIPAAKAVRFSSVEAEGQESIETPFLFPPVSVTLDKEAIEDLTNEEQYSANDLDSLKHWNRLSKLRADESVYGDFEITCVMREEGDTNRIDKMIAELNPQNPWQPARTEHLLALAKSNPELINGPIVALGSEIKQNGNIPCMEPGVEGARYTNHPRVAGFNPTYQFLVFRKK